jgi:general stress protein 26
MNANEINRSLSVARSIMLGAEFCFLITHSRQGEMHARLMQPFEPEEDLSVWFGASPNSRKVHEIEQNHLVTLTYHHAAENAYVSIQGRATLHRDLPLRKQYWRESWFAFWPQGPEGDDYILIQVLPYQIEVMNFEQGVAPEPYGLRPLILTKELDQWVVLEDISA